MELGDILSPDEVLEIEDAMEKISDSQICEALDELARREVALLKDPRLGDDPEIREITRWNVAALCAAGIRIGSRKPGAEPDKP